jgi:hypothetical protein
MNQLTRADLPLVLVFFTGTVLFFFGMALLGNRTLDFRVLIAANCLFFLLGLAAFRMQTRAMRHSNPNVFVRSVMGAMMLKMFICLIAVMGYVLLSGKEVNRPSVYISLLIYGVYLVTEVALVMKLNKRKNA